jgi:hypothetical protein
MYHRHKLLRLIKIHVRNIGWGVMDWIIVAKDKKRWRGSAPRNLEYQLTFFGDVYNLVTES